MNESGCEDGRYGVYFKSSAKAIRQASILFAPPEIQSISSHQPAISNHHFQLLIPFESSLRMSSLKLLVENITLAPSLPSPHEQLYFCPLKRGPLLFFISDEDFSRKRGLPFQQLKGYINAYLKVLSYLLTLEAQAWHPPSSRAPIDRSS